MCACFLVFAADSLGRRKSLLWTSVAMALSMLYVGLYVRISPPVKGQAVPPAGYVALVCIFLFASFFQWGWGPVCWIYISEVRYLTTAQSETHVLTIMSADPDCSSPWPERSPWRRYPMVSLKHYAS